MTFSEWIHSKAGAAADRIEVAENGLQAARELRHGVVFIHAMWSAGSIFSFAALCHEVAAVPTARFPILVLNTDELDYDAFREFSGEIPHGWGEAYWIRDGQIIHRDHGYGRVPKGEPKDVLKARIHEWSDTP